MIIIENHEKEKFEKTANKLIETSHENVIVHAKIQLISVHVNYFNILLDPQM